MLINLVYGIGQDMYAHKTGSNEDTIIISGFNFISVTGRN